MVEEAHLDTFKWMLDASVFVYDATLESIRSLFGEPALGGDLADAWDSEWGSEDEGDNAAEETDGESGDEESENENSEPEEGNVDEQYSEEEDADDDAKNRNAEDEEEEDGEEKHDDDYGGDETVLPPTMVSTGREVPSAYYRSLTKRSMKVKFTAGKGFIEWLSSSDGIFHISGKMGSGKSKLMRFLYEHPETTYELNQWAGEYSQIMAISTLSTILTIVLLRGQSTGVCQLLLLETRFQPPKEPDRSAPRSPTRDTQNMHGAHTCGHARVLEANKRAAMARSVRHPNVQQRHPRCFDALDTEPGNSQQISLFFFHRWPG